MQISGLKLLMNQKDVFNMKNDTGSVIAAIIGVVIFYIIISIIMFGAGWLGGLILTQTVGWAVATGLNALFGATRFTPDLIPVVCGVLIIIGSYFKTSVSNNKK